VFLFFIHQGGNNDTGECTKGMRYVKSTVVLSPSKLLLVNSLVDESKSKKKKSLIFDML
jgi:hypothetical protein